MALRFIDSFDDRDTASLLLKYNGGAGGTINGLGRNGTQGCADPDLQKSLDAQATWIVGFAIYVDSWLPGSQVLVDFFDTDTSQVAFKLHDTGFITAIRKHPGGETVLGVTSQALSLITWHYLEFKATINDTNGVAAVHLDEIEVLNLTSQDTQMTLNASANQVRVGGALDITIDDLFICDSSGAKNNDFLGDQRVEAVLPDGAGTPATAEWVSSGGGASTWQNVDEVPPDEDTTYNYQSGSGLPKKDVWAFPDIPSSNAVIAGLQVNTLGKKTDAGGAAVKHVCRSGGSDYLSALFSLATGTYEYNSTIWELNPDGDVDWIVATVNAAEFGYSRTA